MDTREERLANNEVLFREVNERIEQIAAPQDPDDPQVFEFYCECSTVDCTLRLPMTLAAYESIRADPTQFVVVPGHELPEIEAVISRTDAYQIVRKQGEAAEIAEATDPRA